MDQSTGALCWFIQIEKDVVSSDVENILNFVPADLTLPGSEFYNYYNYIIVMVFIVFSPAAILHVRPACVCVVMHACCVT